MESGKASNFEASDDENGDQPEKFSTGGGGGKSGMGRSYDCTYCKRGFTNAQALGGHMNIHRKDKAKAKQNNSSKESSLLLFPSKSNHEDQAYNINSRYFSTVSSDHQTQYYQNYFPLTNPSNQHAYSYNLQPSRPENEEIEENDANLSLNIGLSNHVDDDNEVDLELRLGHHR